MEMRGNIYIFLTLAVHPWQCQSKFVRPIRKTVLVPQRFADCKKSTHWTFVDLIQLRISQRFPWLPHRNQAMLPSSLWIYAQYRIVEDIDLGQPFHLPMSIEGQLNAAERQFITSKITGAAKKPEIAIEVGTWLGGGSTLHILRALEKNGCGHLWGIEVDRSIYDRMLANIRHEAPESATRFTPLFGFSQDELKKWKKAQPESTCIDFVFLDGGNNPREQIEEFELLDPLIPVGRQLLTHDAKMRKGRWLVPFISRLDNWESNLNDISENGLFYAQKKRLSPSIASLRAAKKHLFRQMCQPSEIAASFLPSGLCKFILGIFPKRIAQSLTDGRNNPA
jgi:predicted O-methyltransferase YrrM